MKEKKNSDIKTSDKKKITSKQVVALGGVVLLVLMYVITLIVAIVDKSGSGRMFALCLLATIAIPILIWIYTWMYGKLTGKKTIADFSLERPDAASDEEPTDPTGESS